MKAIAKVAVNPGLTEFVLPQDATIKSCLMLNGAPTVLFELNPVTAGAIPEVTWHVHLSIDGGQFPDSAEYVGCLVAQNSAGEQLAVVLYAERSPLILPAAEPAILH